MKQVGQFATAVAQNLKDSPALLALLCLNVIFIAVFVWLLNEINARSVKGLENQNLMISELKESLQVCRSLLKEQTQ